MKKRGIVIIVILALLVIAGLASFFLYVYEPECSDAGCFSSKLGKCERARYISESDEASWEFDIKGRGIFCMASDKFCDNCEVNAKLLQAKKGDSELAGLEGLEMECELPFGFAGNPQDDLSMCNGLLKEKMQEMIINKLHSYILANIGKIGEELNRIA